QPGVLLPGLASELLQPGDLRLAVGPRAEPIERLAAVGALALAVFVADLEHEAVGLRPGVVHFQEVFAVAGAGERPRRTQAARLGGGNLGVALDQVVRRGPGEDAAADVELDATVVAVADQPPHPVDSQPGPPGRIDIIKVWILLRGVMSGEPEVAALHAVLG